MTSTLTKSISFRLEVSEVDRLRTESRISGKTVTEILLEDLGKVKDYNRLENKLEILEFEMAELKQAGGNNVKLKRSYRVSTSLNADEYRHFKNTLEANNMTQAKALRMLLVGNRAETEMTPQLI